MCINFIIGLKLAIIIVNHNVEICTERVNKKAFFFFKFKGSAQDNGEKENNIVSVAIGGSLCVLLVVIVAGVFIVCRKYV